MVLVFIARNFRRSKSPGQGGKRTRDRCLARAEPGSRPAPDSVPIANMRSVARKSDGQLGAADVGDAGLGKTEKSDFALLGQISHRAGHLLDRHRRDQYGVDRGDRYSRCSEPSTALRICSGRLALSSPTRFPPSKRKPNLVAITTWSRRPLKARPSPFWLSDNGSGFSTL
jgi:hypothetical protein